MSPKPSDLARHLQSPTLAFANPHVSHLQVLEALRRWTLDFRQASQQDSNIQALSYTPTKPTQKSTAPPALAPNFSCPVAAYHVLCIASVKRSPHPAAVWRWPWYINMQTFLNTSRILNAASLNSPTPEPWATGFFGRVTDGNSILISTSHWCLVMFPSFVQSKKIKTFPSPNQATKPLVA